MVAIPLASEKEADFLLLLSRFCWSRNYKKIVRPIYNFSGS